MTLKKLLIGIITVGAIAFAVTAPASNLTITRFRAQSVTGAALPGAKLYFYDAGTTTPKNTYSDQALTTPNTNPVIADGSGWFSEIYMIAAAYKVVLKTSGNSTVWTSDNYYPAKNEYVTTLTATSASSTAALTAENSSTGESILATNSGSGLAISATGGASSPAISCVGGAGAGGIVSTGGASAGNGGTFTGGASDGIGVVTTGDGTGYGIGATGGDDSGIGGRFVGGASNGPGVYALGTGTGTGVTGDTQASTGYACSCLADATSPVRAALRLLPQNAAPSSPAEGDTYANSADKHLYFYNGSAWKQLDN